jgi:hypothetical protein
VKVPLQTRQALPGPGRDFDAEADGRETMPHQALSGRAEHFVVERLRVSSGENMLLQTPAAQELLPGGEFE